MPLRAVLVSCISYQPTQIAILQIFLNLMLYKSMQPSALLNTYHSEVYLEICDIKLIFITHGHMIQWCFSFYNFS